MSEDLLETCQFASPDPDLVVPTLTPCATHADLVCTLSRLIKAHSDLVSISGVIAAQAALSGLTANINAIRYSVKALEKDFIDQLAAQQTGCGEPPVLSLIGGSISLNVGGSFVDPGATAVDVEDGDISALITSSHNVNTAVAGSYTVTYSVTDSDGNTVTATRSVTVSAVPVDAPPVITVIGGTVSQQEGTPYADAGATALDPEDGDITGSIVVVSTVNTSVPGAYTVTYTVTDSGGNTVQAVRDVNITAIVDEPPVISLVGPTPYGLVIVEGGVLVDPGATALDPEDGDITGSIIADDSGVDVNVPGVYSITYTVTDSGGNTVISSRSVEVVAAGYYASPTGLPGNPGTFESPWDIQSALETQTIPAGETLYLKPGTYFARPASGANSLASVDYPGQTVNAYEVNHSDITIRPYGVTCDDPYPVTLQFGLIVKGDNTTIEGFRATNPTTFPLPQPAPAGSPYPGFPAAAPAGWAYWESGGHFKTDGAAPTTGITFRNNVVSGGSGGFSSFQCTALTLEGNIAFNVGWIAVDRRHGHPFYLQNPSNLLADLNTYRNNIASTSNRRDNSLSGSFAMHFYATTPDEQNWLVVDSYVKGSAIYQSDTGIAQNATYSNILGEAAAIGTSAGANGGDNMSWGRAANADDLLTLEDITYVNGRKVADNEIWTNLTQSNIRQVKTRADWYVTEMDQPPGFALTEVGTHVEAPIPDEYQFNVIDLKLAHAYIADFDDDGEVTIDLATGGFATVADEYCVYHYANPTVPVVSGSLSGGTTITLQIAETNSATGLLDSTDAYIIRLA